MQVLLCLARRAPAVVTKDELFRDVWQGVFVTDEALTFVIWELRKALGDDARRPRFIETIPKRGYRLIGSPSFEEGPVASELPVKPPTRRARGVGLFAGAFGLVVGIGIATWSWVRDGDLPEVRFHERDWVLMANFENRTGEPLFDGSLDYVLEQELMGSTFVNVAPRERIEDTLRLMRRPLDTEIDVDLSREIALRDGGIRAILAGRIEKAATEYLLSVRVVDPASGATVSSLSARADGREEVLPSLRGLSDRLRQVLGEELPVGDSLMTLRRATTRSLEALQLFSRALEFADQDKWLPARELLERAVREDPEFASAHIWLAHAMSNLGNGNAVPHYEKAFALAEGLPDRERYFILGSYYSRHLGDDEKAVQAFEILTELYPDDYWAAHKLANAYSRLGRYREAGACQLRLADLRPHGFSENLQAVFYLLKIEGRRVTDTLYFQRAKALATLETATRFPEGVAELELVPAWEYWMDGDLPRTLEEVERAARLAESWPSPAATYLVEFVGRAYLDLGMIQAAESRFGAAPDEDRRNYLLAQAALARGDEDSFVRYVSGVDIASHLRTHWMDASAVALSRGTGVLSAARAERVASVLDAMQRDSLPDLLREWVRDFSTAARGELLLARGRAGEAIPLLEEAVEELRPRPRPVFFLAVESLAEAWEREGNRERARQVLAEAARQKNQAFDDGLFWMRVQLRLAELDRSLGRHREAREIESELRRLLVYADRDHAILRGIDRLSRAPIRTADGASTEGPAGSKETLILP
jgi:tetratricopeptide (TPR) repeat protein